VSACQQQIHQQEVIVLLADECHLLWGDVCGYGWGKTTQRLSVTVSNPKERQSYFGALNGKTGQLLLQPAHKADSAATVAFLAQLRQHYSGKQVWVIWDNASYHTSQLVKDYLKEVNGQLPQEHWPLTLIGLATNAPEQNPIEQVWLDGKTKLRKQAGLNTFAQVKKYFVDSIADNIYNYEKFKWYFP
jgi:putative transposase